MTNEELLFEARERAGYMALLAELTKNEPAAVTAREEADRMTRFADALEAVQNNNSRLERELLDHASHIGTLGEQIKNLVKALDAVEDEKRSLAERLAALTTPQDGCDALEAAEARVKELEAQVKDFKCEQVFRISEMQELVEAQALVAELEAGIERVRAIHRKYTYYELEDSCPDTSQDHREERHQESDEIGEFYCEDMPTGDVVCDLCRDADGERMDWPCPTIAALDTPAPVESEGEEA